MKNLILALFLLNLVACTEREYITTPEKVVVTEKEILVEKEHETIYSGYYNLDGASDVNCIYLDEKFPNVVDLEIDCQSLVTINPENGTLGQFPVMTLSNLNVIEGKMRYTRNINYNSGNDLEEDVSGSNITGNKRTDFLFEVVDSKLRITISIYENANNDNLNEIVAVRVFNEI